MRRKIGYRADPRIGWSMFRRSGIRFADKDMRQHKNLRRFPVISDHWSDPI
jgi:hypothetical protein